MRTMSEKELDQLAVAGDRFAKELAVLAAKVIVRFSPDVEEHVRAYLQDHTSLYSPYTAGRIRNKAKVLRNAIDN